jgi:LemA protein
MIHTVAASSNVTKHASLPSGGYRSQRGVSALIIVLGIVAVLALWGIGGYNSLVGEQTTVEQAASNIDTQLKRRADLIPNLVQTVKGYAKHEKGVFEDIAAARSRLLNANSTTDPKAAAAANAQMSGALGRLLAVAENYPNLKADQNFNKLQDTLEGTENRINYARLQYNDVVKSYNVKVRTFPNNILAGLFGFQAKVAFEASEAEKATPKVEF